MNNIEPQRIEDLLTEPGQYDEFWEAIRTNNLETFKKYYKDLKLKPQDELKGLPLTFLAINADRLREEEYRSVDILMFLLEEGADVNYLSLGTRATDYTRSNWQNVVEPATLYATLAMNAAVSGDLELLKILRKYGADLDIELQSEDGTSIPNESALGLAQNRLVLLDNNISYHMAELNYIKSRPVGRQFTAQDKAENIEHEDEALKENIEKRMKMNRVLKWLRSISTDKNIPTAVSKNQYAAFRNVLQKRAPLGRFEEKYMTSFLQKPATFQISPTETGVKRINTTLFQGGRTRKRRARKQRKTRSRK